MNQRLYKIQDTVIDLDKLSLVEVYKFSVTLFLQGGTKQFVTTTIPQATKIYDDLIDAWAGSGAVLDTGGTPILAVDKL
jgi:hypothetical protein